MNFIEEAVALKLALDDLRPLEADQEALIMDKFKLDWNFHSNHLEGNSLTYNEVKALLLYGVTAQGKPLKDHFEITGHDEALSWIISLVSGSYPLTENFIRELHTLLLKSPYEVKAITPDGQPTTRRIAVGQYKTAPNHVKTKTGKVFRFASPEETPALMSDLLAWYRSESEREEVNPIVLAAEFHYRFIRIHPFDDGNGRTARILMNFILMRFGYPPVIVKTDDKEKYFAALREADAGKTASFVNYIAENLVKSLYIMLAGARGENIEEEDDGLKELALLKAKLAKQSSSKTPSLAYDTIEKFKDEVKPLLDEVIEQVDELFGESDETVLVDGKPYTDLISTSGLGNVVSKAFRHNSLKIYGKDLYQEDIKMIDWRRVMRGLKGAKNGNNIVLQLRLFLADSHPRLSVLVADEPAIEQVFSYDDMIDDDALIRIKRDLLKNLIAAIKKLV